MKKHFLFTSFCVLFALSVSTSFGQAQTLVTPRRSCTAPANCSALIVPGTYRFVGAYGSQRASFKFFTTGPDECIRIDVPDDPVITLDMALYCPGGLFVRRIADSTGNGPLFAGSAPVRGDCEVSVGSTFGTGPTRNIIIQYGRYNLGNLNCSQAYR